MVRTAPGLGIRQIGLKIGVKLSQVVPQPGPMAQVRRSEFRGELRRESGDLLQVGTEVVLDAVHVLRMREGHSPQLLHRLPRIRIENSIRQHPPGFNEIKFKMGGRVYSDTHNGHGAPRSWTVRIQLSEKDYLNLSREFEAQAPPIVARFSDVIGQVLSAKTSALRPLASGADATRKSTLAPPAFKAQGAA